MRSAEIDFSNREQIEAGPSANGTVTLSWEKAEEDVVLLEQADDAAFSSPVQRYQGTDAGSVISGLAEGTHHFRLTAADGTISSPLTVKVEFFPRDQLFLLLGAGGIVVLATAGAIIAGWWRNRHVSDDDGREEIAA